MTVGQGVVSQAMQQSQEMQLKRDALAEEKRSNVAKEFQVNRRTNLMEKESARADFQTMQQVQAHADKVVGFATNAMGDLYRQNEKLVSNYNEIKKAKARLYNKNNMSKEERELRELTGQTKTDSTWALDKVESDPDVVDAKNQILANQEAFDKVQEMVGQYSAFLPYSSVGSGVENLIKYEMTPWERMNTSAEDLTAYGQNQIDSINDILSKQQEFNNEMAANAIYATEEAKAKAVQPFALEQIEAQQQGTISKATQQARQQAINNIATVIATDVTSTVNDLINQMNNQFNLEEPDADKLRSYIRTPESVVTAQKAFYNQIPDPESAIRQDSDSIAALTTLMAQKRTGLNKEGIDNRVAFWRDEIPVIIDFMTKGTELNSTDQKVMDNLGIKRLSVYPGVNNPLTSVLNPLAQISNMQFVTEDALKRFADSRQITSQSRMVSPQNNVPSVPGE